MIAIVIAAKSVAVIDLFLTNWPVVIGVSASWRPQPCSRSTAAVEASEIVADAAPYADIPIMTAIAILPLPSGSCPYS